MSWDVVMNIVPVVAAAAIAATKPGRIILAGVFTHPFQKTEIEIKVERSGVSKAHT